MHGLALVSPGLAYRGVDIREPMDTWLSQRRPLLLFAGERDGPSADAVSVLAPVQGAGLVREVFAGASEHGVALCNAAPSAGPCSSAGSARRWTRPRPPPAAPPQALPSTRVDP